MSAVGMVAGDCAVEVTHQIELVFAGHRLDAFIQADEEGFVLRELRVGEDVSVSRSVQRLGRGVCVNDGHSLGINLQRYGG
jgi:hypothetical protein